MGLLKNSFLFCLLFVLSISLTSALSLSGLTIDPSSNIYTNQNFSCVFTPQGTGILTANVTWYQDNILISSYDVSGIVQAGEAVPRSFANVPSGIKNDVWRCQVTLTNTTHSIVQNSSSITILNSLPEIQDLERFTFYEDTTYSMQLVATDADNDVIKYDFLPSDTPVIKNFDRDSGEFSIAETDETNIGNHTITFIAYDDDPLLSGKITRTLEIIAVNDPPEFGELYFECEETVLCEGLIPATDEENDSLTFSTNETFINLTSIGLFSFTPTRSNVGIHAISVNVTDGMNTTTGIAIFNISSTNLPPEFTWNSTTYGIQNQTTPFLFYINATDPDSNDDLEFSISSPYCDIDVWSITKIINLTNTTEAQAVVNVTFTNPSTWLPNTTQSNDFVMCRNVTLSVTDGQYTANRNITFNITNVNDPPILYPISYESSMTNMQDIRNITSARGLSFSYQLNYTDPDLFTYASDELTFSLQNHNASLFQIDSETGEITSVIPFNVDNVGVHLFDVFVTDALGLIDSVEANITVVDNTLPVFRDVNTSSCLESISCIKEIIADDAEGNHMDWIEYALEIHPPYLLENGSVSYNESLAQTYTDDEIQSLFIETTYVNDTSLISVVNITANNSLIGLYMFNVSVRDLYEVVTTSFSFEILNVNDAPMLDNDDNHATIEPINFGVLVEDVAFSKEIFAYDPDLIHPIDELTFNYTLQNESNLTGITFNKESDTSALFSFTPTSENIGQHTVNITVTDRDGLFDTQEVNFTIYSASGAPIITAISPYTDAGELITDLYRTPEPDHISSITTNESESILFRLTATDPEGDAMTVTWFVNDIQKQSSAYAFRDYTHNFGYYDEGVHEIKAVVEDLYFSKAEYTWEVTVENTNRPPVFRNDLAELLFDEGTAIAGTQTYVNFFRLTTLGENVFLDYDDLTKEENQAGKTFISSVHQNNLVFSINESSSCLEFAEFNFTGVDVKIVPEMVGTCTANFIATDPYNESVYSNTIRIDIISLDQKSTETQIINQNTGSRTVTETVTVPYERRVDVPVAFDLVRAQEYVILDDGALVIPIILNNTWDGYISGITLSANATFANDEEIIFSGGTYVEGMEQGSLITFNITLSSYRLEGPYMVIVEAEVNSLEYTDTEVIFINALEKGGEDITSLKSRIGFARDLLMDNPECQELNELLDGAVNSVGTDPRSALEIVNNVVNGCKYIVNLEQEKNSNIVPQSFIGNLVLPSSNIIDYKLLITIFIGLLLATGIIAVSIKSTLKKI